MPKDVRSPLRSVSAMGLRAQCDSAWRRLEDSLEVVQSSQRRHAFSNSVADIRFECGSAVGALSSTLRPTVEGWLEVLGPRATAVALDVIDRVVSCLKSILSRVVAAESALDIHEHTHEIAHVVAMECIEAYKSRTAHAEDVVEANFLAMRELESTLAQSREYVATVMQERVEWQSTVGSNPVHLPTIIEGDFVERCEQASRELSTVTSPKQRRDWPSVPAANCVAQRFKHSLTHSARGVSRYIRPQEELHLLQRLLGRGSDELVKLQDDAERRIIQRQRLVQIGATIGHVVTGLRTALEELRSDIELSREQFYRTLVADLHLGGASRAQGMIHPEPPKKRSSLKRNPSKIRRESAMRAVRSVAPFAATDPTARDDKSLPATRSSTT